MRYKPAILVGTLTGLLGAFVGSVSSGIAATGGGEIYVPMTTGDILWALAPQIAVGAVVGFAFGFGATTLVTRFRSRKHQPDEHVPERHAGGVAGIDAPPG